MVKTYTLVRIDAASITKSGRELFAKMPQDIQDDDTEGRVVKILSLMARNGANAWRAMENGSGASPRADLYCRRAWSVEGDARAAEFAKADKANDEWVKHWERVERGCEKRLDALAALLSDITGHSWRIDTSGGGMGDVLVIPATLTGGRDNTTTYHTNERAIWLNG